MTGSESGGARIGRSRKQVVLTVAGLLLVLVLGAGAAAALGLVRLPGSADSARPPCDQLSTVREVESALSTHPALVERIENVGAGVRVSLAKPCGTADRAIVHITFTSQQEREGVNAVLVEDTGFGTAVELVGA